MLVFSVIPFSRFNILPCLPAPLPCQPVHPPPSCIPPRTCVLCARLCFCPHATATMPLLPLLPSHFMLLHLLHAHLLYHTRRLGITQHLLRCACGQANVWACTLTRLPCACSRFHTHTHTSCHRTPAHLLPAARMAVGLVACSLPAGWQATARQRRDSFLPACLAERQAQGKTLPGQATGGKRQAWRGAL